MSGHWPDLYSHKFSSISPAYKKPYVTQSLPYIRTVDKWKKELNADWLDLEVEGNIVVQLSCNVCKKYSAQKIGPYITGTRNVKKGSVLFHMRSDAHQQAIKVKQDSPSSQPNI